MSKKLSKAQRNNVVRVAQLYFGAQHVSAAMKAEPVTSSQWPDANVALADEVIWNAKHRAEHACILKTSDKSQRSRAGWPACKFVYVSGGDPEQAQAYCNKAAAQLEYLRGKVERMNGYVVEAAKKDIVAVEQKRIEKMTTKQQARLRAALGW